MVARLALRPDCEGTRVERDDLMVARLALRPDCEGTRVERDDLRKSECPN